MHIIWTIIIGFIAGVIAKFITPGDNEPSGFILTTILGIIGAFVATYLGQAIGWYRADEGAGLIGAVVGAAVGAAGGAIAGGGKGAGKGAAIGGVVGVGGGTLYGLNENKKHDELYRDAYARCMSSRGYAG